MFLNCNFINSGITSKGSVNATQKIKLSFIGCNFTNGETFENYFDFQYSNTEVNFVNCVFDLNPQQSLLISSIPHRFVEKEGRFVVTSTYGELLGEGAEMRFCSKCNSDPLNHAGHDSYIVLENGAATFIKAGTHIYLKNLDWSIPAKYVLEYDMNASEVKEGGKICFNYGEATAWYAAMLEIKKEEGKLFYYASMNYRDEIKKGEIDTNMHVKVSFEKVGLNLVNRTTVSDASGHSYTYEVTSANLFSNTDAHSLYWNTYDGWTPGSTVVIRNMTFMRMISAD